MKPTGTKKKRFTFQQHVEMGKRLKRLRAEITALQMELGPAYPYALHESLLLKMAAQVSRLRSRLEDEMFKEHPTQANLKVYYGAEEPPASGPEE